MRVVNGVSCLLLIVFVAVQYNDPDFYFWMPVYAIPAVWAGIACLRPRWLVHRGVPVLLALLLVAAVLGSIWFWPSEPDFWRRDVWWQSETAREGMGMMIVAIALALVALSAYRVALRIRGGR